MPDIQGFNHIIQLKIHRDQIDKATFHIYCDTKESDLGDIFLFSIEDFQLSYLIGRVPDFKEDLIEFEYMIHSDSLSTVPKD